MSAKGQAVIAIGPHFTRQNKLSLVRKTDTLGLCRRERQLYDLIVLSAPKSLKEIGHIMVASEGSIKVFVHNLAKRLGVTGVRGIMGFEIQRLRDEIGMLRMTDSTIDFDHPGAD